MRKFNTDLEMAQSAYGNRKYSIEDRGEYVDFGDGKKWFIQEKQSNVDGYKAYVLTDNPDPNKSTEAYYSVRGSDGFNSNNPDWFSNDIPFALNNKVPAQSKDFSKNLNAQIEKYPNIKKWNVSGHSLATMVIVTGLANINNLDAIGKVSLFNGPDVSRSLSKAQLARVKTIEGRIDYFLNPDDPVSNLNRGFSDQLGNVNYILPKSPIGNKSLGVAHGFTEYLLNPDNSIKTIENDFALRNYVNSQNMFYTQAIDYLNNKHISNRDIQRIVSILEQKNLSIEDYSTLAYYFVTGVDIGKLISLMQTYQNAKKQFQLVNDINAKVSGTSKVSADTELVNEIAQLIEMNLAGVDKNYENQIQTAHAQMTASVKRANDRLDKINLGLNYSLSRFWNNQHKYDNIYKVREIKKEMSNTSHLLVKATNNLFDIENLFSKAFSL